MTMRHCLMLAMLACGVAPLEAQTLRPYTTFRQWHGEQRLDAAIGVCRGSLRLARGRPEELYRAEFAYDPESSTPTSGYDSAARALTIGSAKVGCDTSFSTNFSIVISIDDDELTHKPARPTTSIKLSPQVDAALTLTLNSVDADLDLGGLRVPALKLHAAAGETTIRFSQPNGTPCRDASMRATAGELSLHRLANSRCETIDVQGGVGTITLDFGGTWTASMNARVTSAVGGVTLRLPRDVGVRLTTRSFLADLDPEGMVRRNDSFVSPNYDRTTHHLDIDLTMTIGEITVEWIDE